MEYNKLSLATYNRNEACMLDELCNKTTNVIAVQEHWLRSDELDKFNIINANFNYHAVSAMDNAVSCGILKGRPFGEYAFYGTNVLIVISRCLVMIRLVGALLSNLTLI